MRYMVQFQTAVDPGNRLEDSGGTGPLLSFLVERFQPESFFVGPAGREGWMVVELEEPRQIVELTAILSRRLGAYPTLTPVVAAAEYARLAAGNGEALRRLP